MCRKKRYIKTFGSQPLLSGRGLGLQHMFDGRIVVPSKWPTKDTGMTLTVLFQIEALLETYVSAAMTSLCPSQGKVEQLEAHYRVSNIVLFCLLHGKQLSHF